jgi:hypothetical protein
LQVTADDAVIKDVKTVEGNQLLQITMLIFSGGHVISATAVGNAIQVILKLNMQLII